MVRRRRLHEQDGSGGSRPLSAPDPVSSAWRHCVRQCVQWVSLPVVAACEERARTKRCSGHRLCGWDVVLAPPHTGHGKDHASVAA